MHSALELDVKALNVMGKPGDAMEQAMRRWNAYLPPAPSGA
ncbi:MAG: hypothetical protein Q8M07_31290 [Prosthecobacter sp.]|nr:hypothetical protein [Prosthecobacter sp.]